jgi:hypothetical protein
MRSCFSLFTTNKMYLLQMWQVRQAFIVSKSVKPATFKRDLDNYLAAHPNTSLFEAFRHCAKHSVKSNQAGTPGWYHNRLLDLTAMCDR